MRQYFVLSIEKIEISIHYLFPDLVTQLISSQPKCGDNGHVSTSARPRANHVSQGSGVWDVVALHVAPEMGERIMISGWCCSNIFWLLQIIFTQQEISSGSRDTLEGLFPELSHTLQDTRHTLAWNTSSKYVIR